MKFNNMPVARKLWLLLAGLMLAMLALMAGLLRYVSYVDADVARVVQFNEDRMTMALRWKGMTELSVERAAISAVSSDAALVNRLQQQIKAGVDGISKIQKQVTEAAFSPEDKQQLERIAAERAIVLKFNAQAQDARSAGDLAAAQKIVDEQLLPAVAKYTGAQDAFVDLQELQRDRAKANGASRQSRAQWLGAALAAVVLLVSGVLAMLMVRSITGPLQRAVGLAGVIAAGDLTADVHDDRKDELGDLLRSLSAMAARLRGVVGEVRGGVESVSAASSQIATGNQDLSARTEQTAANLEETAASMEELTATVTQSADTARQANQLAGTAAQAAARGGEVVGQVVASMQQITDSSRKIADIIGVIDSIAFQTNILALNAAVEAARAGEQGRGFAVVAGEVRSLAQRSAEAAREVRTLIGTSVRQVESSAALIRSAGEGIAAMTDGIRDVVAHVGEISHSVTEQGTGLGEISAAVQQIDQITQRNAQMVNENLHQAQALERRASTLSEAVTAFRLQQGTAQEAMALVVRAAQLHRGAGSRDAFLRTLTDPAQPFHDRDMYVFALDAAGTYLAFGGNPAKVGTRVQDIPGIAGDRLVQDIAAQAERGPGWVEYDITNPATGTVQTKMSFVQRVGDVYLGCGVYKTLAARA